MYIMEYKKECCLCFIGDSIAESADTSSIKSRIILHSLK